MPVHSGDCLPMDDYCKINLFYRPVCGSDGRTYTNLESLLCVNYKYSLGKQDKFYVHLPCTPLIRIKVWESWLEIQLTSRLVRGSRGQNSSQQTPGSLLHANVRGYCYIFSSGRRLGVTIQTKNPLSSSQRNSANTANVTRDFTVSVSFRRLGPPWI